MKRPPRVRDPLEETQENPALPSIRTVERRRRLWPWVVLALLVAAVGCYGIFV